jgi:hypothetical protein
MPRADRQRELLDAEDWDLIVLDEAHHARRSFQQAAGNPSAEAMEYLSALFRATEAAFGELSDSDAGRILPDASNLKRKKVLRALRDVSAILRRTLDAESRRAAARMLQAGSPLHKRMVRNTRDLLRKYKLPIPNAGPA